MFVSTLVSCNSQFASDEILLACESYHIPAHVAPHVDLVTPTVHFNTIVSRTPGTSHHEIRGSDLSMSIGMQGQRPKSPKTSGVISETFKFNQLDQCDKLITPLCLRTLYGLEYKPRATINNSFAIGY